MRTLTRLLLVGLVLTLGASVVLAQESHIVGYDGFSFTLDEAIASSVNITQYPGDPAEFGPGFAEPAYTEFIFYNEFPVPQCIGDAIGGVRIYRTADFEGYTEHEIRAGSLQSMLEEQVDLTQYEVSHRVVSENALPFIPVYAAGQSFRARSHYVETDQVAGVAYITLYQEVQEPFLSDSSVWTFQGLSADGQYYISAIFNITNDVFPAELAPDYDPAVFQAEYGEYHAKYTQWVNDAGPEAFSPGLETLEALVESFAFAE
jgi:hypothetical protein